jgi:hypothetical protein
VPKAIRVTSVAAAAAGEISGMSRGAARGGWGTGSNFADDCLDDDIPF